MAWVDKTKAQALLKSGQKKVEDFQIEEVEEQEVIETPEGSAKETVRAFLPETMQATEEGAQFPVMAGIKDVASLAGRGIASGAETIYDKLVGGDDVSKKTFAEKMSTPNEERSFAGQIVSDPMNIPLAAIGGPLASAGLKSAGMVGKVVPKIAPTVAKHVIPALGDLGLLTGAKTLEQATEGQEITPYANLKDNALGAVASGGLGALAEKAGKGLFRAGTKQGMKDLGIKPSLRKKTENIDMFVDQYMRGEATEDIGKELSKVAKARNELLDEYGKKYGDDDLKTLADQAKDDLKSAWMDNKTPKGAFTTTKELDKAMASIDDIIELEGLKFNLKEDEFIKPSEILKLRSQIDEKIGFGSTKQEKANSVAYKYLRKALDKDVYKGLKGEGIEKAKDFDRFLGERIPMQKLADADATEGIAGYSTDVVGDVFESLGEGNVGGTAGMLRDALTGSGKKRRAAGAIMQPQYAPEFLQSQSQQIQGLAVPEIVAETANIRYPRALQSRGMAPALIKGASKAGLYNQLRGQ